MRGPRTTPGLRAAAAAAAVWLASCAGPGGDGGARLQPVASLPEDRRELLAAYGAGGPAWEARREEVRADPELARFLVQNLTLELHRAYDRAVLAGVGEDDGPFERARAELVWFADSSTPLLAELLTSEDSIVRLLAADVLGEIGAPAVAPVAELLHGESRAGRRAAAELLASLPHAGAGEEAIQARLGEVAEGDADWVVRAQAARSLGQRGTRHVTTRTARLALQRVLGDGDPAVAREAALGLAALDDPEAIPALINLLERAERDADPRAHAAGEEALRALTGVSLPSNARAWRDWWREHRNGVLGAGGSAPY